MQTKPESQPAKRMDRTATPNKKKRFRIVKLEERIAPGNGGGGGSNATCGNFATCHNKNTCVGCGSQHDTLPNTSIF